MSLFASESYTKSSDPTESVRPLNALTALLRDAAEGCGGVTKRGEVPRECVGVVGLDAGGVRVDSLRRSTNSPSCRETGVSFDASWRNVEESKVGRVSLGRECFSGVACVEFGMLMGGLPFGFTLYANIKRNTKKQRQKEEQKVNTKIKKRVKRHTPRLRHLRRTHHSRRPSPYHQNLPRNIRYLRSSRSRGYRLRVPHPFWDVTLHGILQ